MANAIYPFWKQSLMTEGDANKSLDQSGSNAPTVALITTASGYTYSASHQFYSSLSNIVGTPQPITSPTVANGTFNGATVTFTAVSGTVVGALAIYRQNIGSNSTWRLVLFEDTGVTGLPLTPNGGNVVISWNASGIFTLSDRRAKRDLRPLGWAGPLPFYSYRYRNQPGRRAGFLAQDVERLMPEAVKTFGCVKAVDYNRVLHRLAA